jgi:hypothetical protein
VILFLDRLPLYAWTDNTRTPPLQRWSVPLPVLPADPALAAPSGAVPQRWVLDTGFTGDGFAWRRHLEAAGLDPDVEQTGTIRARSSLGVSEVVPVRNADLWLFSNLPALRGRPFRLELDPGIAFRNVAQRPDPEFHRPLVGMRALRRAGVKVQINFAQATVSLWVPGPWLQSVVLLGRRVLSGYATVPMPW